MTFGETEVSCQPGRPAPFGGWHAIPCGISSRLSKPEMATPCQRNCVIQFRGGADRGGVVPEATRRANCAAHPAWHPVAEAPGEPGDQRAGRGQGDPRVGVQDQPHRAGPERHPRDRRARPAHLLRRRPGRARAAADPGRAGQPPRLVAPVQRHPAGLVPVLRRDGRGGDVHPGLRAAVRPGPAADPDLHRRRPGRLRHPAGRGRTARHPAQGTAAPVHRGTAQALGDHRGDRAAAAGRQHGDLAAISSATCSA